jgi:hypothetical protein
MAILIAAVIAFVGLAVDGGRAYYSQRTAQNAADNAALAGAWALCSGGNVNNMAFASALVNGFDNDGITNSVRVYRPPSSGPNSGNDEYIEVVITSSIESSFIKLVYSGEIESTVRAVGQCTTFQFLSHALFAGSSSCNNAINVTGSSAIVSGGVHSNNDMKFSGSDNFIEGSATYVSSVDGAADKITYDPPPPDNPIQIAEVNYPVDFPIDDYAPGGVEAIAAQNDDDSYYSCDCKMDIGWLTDQGLYDDTNKELQDGLYYTSDEIDINVNTIIGDAVTFVAREEISFSGSGQTLAPYVNGLLAYTDKQKPGGSQCASAVISFSGSTQDWSGIIFAPNGKVSLSGSASTTFNGSIISNTIDISGSDQHVQFDPGIAPPPPPTLNLAE